GGNPYSDSDLTLTDGSNITTNTTVGGNIIYVGTTTAATVSGNVSFTGAIPELNINDGADSPDVLLSGTLSTSGAAIITKAGNGTVELSGSASAVGPILVNAGRIAITGGDLTTSHLSF